MKQYIMGMLTGASLILCAVMFMGNAPYWEKDIDDLYNKLRDIDYTVEKTETLVKKIESIVSSIDVYGVDCKNLKTKYQKNRFMPDIDF